jgi:exosortase/archaeosortase family protein
MRGRKEIALRREEKSFLIKFALLFSIPYVLIHFLPLGFLTEFVAFAESKLVSFTGASAAAQGSTLLVDGKIFEIIPDCSGLVMIILFAALLYSTKLSAGKRARGMLLFIPLLFVFNLLRLFLTLMVGVAWGVDAFNAAHVVLWFVDSAVVLLAWAAASEIKI